MTTTELTPKQQLSELIRTSKSILLITHEHPDGDALGSLLALHHALTKMGKKVTSAVDGDIADYYQFLPGINQIEREFSSNKDLLIMVDESQAKVGNVSLKRLGENKLMIVVTPKDGILVPENFLIEDGSFDFDAIIAVDCSSKERLGALADRCADLFYEVPLVNIDHHPGNTNFGKINLVDIAASSTAELLVAILEMVGRDQGLITEQVATCLLAGIISDTSSFQNSNTTPKSLTVAAQLVAAGGKQQEIVRELFKNRSLAMLRLWGRALSYIKEDAPHRFAWSTLSKADFVASQATPDMARSLIDELLKTAQGVDFVLLLTEEDGSVVGNLRSVKPTADVRQLAVSFGGAGHAQAAGFTLEDAKIQEKEQEIISQIRQLLTDGLSAV